MSAGPVDAYLRTLEHALRERGLDPSRVVDEAREHLADAVEGALRRGLAREDAEREAVERFGPPDLIAAQAVPVRSPLMVRLNAALTTVAGHWRWISAATAAAALITSVASYYFLPTRYRSETIILVSNAATPGDGDASSRASREHLQVIRRVILSRPRLERIARDFGLDTRQEAAAPLANAVQQIRHDISVEVLTPEQPENGSAEGVFKVSFQSPDPRLAMRVTERVASMFIEENLRQREGDTSGISQFLESEIDDVRFRLAEQESRLTQLRAQQRPLSRADVLPFEVLQDRYRDLLVKREDARSMAKLARTVLGEQYRILEAARVPDRPVGPRRASINATGALGGLTFAIAALVWRRAPAH
jgi:uncharacterized protein involved in exopolysaccharide biosynthesis